MLEHSAFQKYLEKLFRFLPGNPQLRSRQRYFSIGLRSTIYRARFPCVFHTLSIYFTRKSSGFVRTSSFCLPPVLSGLPPSARVPLSSTPGCSAEPWLLQHPPPMALSSPDSATRRVTKMQQIKRFYSAQGPTLISPCTWVESETLTISSRVFYSCDYFSYLISCHSRHA